MRAVPIRPAILVLALALLLPVGAFGIESAPNRCLGWGIGGAVIGTTVSFYGTAGIYAAATGRPFLDMPLAPIVISELVGLVAGPAVFCGLLDPEAHLIPKASWVSGFGATSLMLSLGGLFLLSDSLFSSTPAGDFVPFEQIFVILAITIASAVGGGYLGAALHDIWHKQESKRPLNLSFGVRPVLGGTRSGFVLSVGGHL